MVKHRPLAHPESPEFFKEKIGFSEPAPVAPPIVATSL
jgi:hypothetical protein